MAPFLRRGLVAGLIGGLVAGLFFFILGEPQIEKALRFEVVPPGGDSVEVFSRTVQRGGLFGATLLYGVALGGILGFLFPFLAPRLRSGSAWERSVRISLTGFVALWFVPFLKYPTNPPAVGDPATVTQRTVLYLAMVALSLGAAIAAWMAVRRLADRGIARHWRQVAVAAGYLGIIGAAYGLLPGNPDPIDIPAKVLWGARMVSATGQALLWTLVGAAYGILTLRAEATRARREVARVGQTVAV